MMKITNKLGYFLVSILGRKILDCETGECYGRAIVIFWNGKLFLLGYLGRPVVPVWQPQKNLEYWRCSLGFRSQAPPDYEKIN